MNTKKIIATWKKRKESTPIIKPLPAIEQIQRHFIGAFTPETGEIELGSHEKDTTTVLWHEMMHKYLFEHHSLEAGHMWDNIAKEIEQHIFNKSLWANMRPFAFSVEKFAKSEPHKHKTLKEKGITITPDIIKKGIKTGSYNKAHKNFLKRFKNE